MKYCTHCGNNMADDALFCASCGYSAGTADSQADINEEKDFLDTTDKMLKFERLVWKIAGIYSLVFYLVYISIWMFAIGTIAIAAEDPVVAIPFVFVITMVSLIVLPIAIINFKMIGKVNYYRETLYNDFTPTLNRITSVGMIVFAALFNQYAMVFIIINFVRANSNKRVIERIIARQSGFNENSDFAR